MATEKELLGVMAQAIKLTEILDLPPLSLALLARLHRAKHGLTLGEAASQMAISRQLLSDIEEGKVPSASKVGALISLYGESFEMGLKFLGIEYDREEKKSA